MQLANYGKVSIYKIKFKVRAENKSKVKPFCWKRKQNNIVQGFGYCDDRVQKSGTNDLKTLIFNKYIHCIIIIVTRMNLCISELTPRTWSLIYTDISKKYQRSCHDVRRQFQIAHKDESVWLGHLKAFIVSSEAEHRYSFVTAMNIYSKSTLQN